VHRSVVSKVAAILRTFRFNGALTVTEIARITSCHCRPLTGSVELADWQLLGRGGPGRPAVAAAGLVGQAADHGECGGEAEPELDDLAIVGAAMMRS
jgi:hypothetical protein